jgi:hypothetical protein
MNVLEHMLQAQIADAKMEARMPKEVGRNTPIPVGQMGYVRGDLKRRLRVRPAGAYKGYMRCDTAKSVGRCELDGKPWRVDIQTHSIVQLTGQPSRVGSLHTWAKGRPTSYKLELDRSLSRHT